MKTRVPFKKRLCLLVIVFPFFLAAIHGAKAQSVMTLQDIGRKFTSFDLTRPAATLDTNTQQELEGLEQVMIERLTNEKKWRWQVGADIAWYWNSNVFLTEKAVSDMIFRPGAGGVLYYGDAESPLGVTAQYTLFYNDFQKRTLPNGIDQTGQLATSWQPAETVNIQSTFSVSDTKGNNIDVGAQTEIIEDRLNLNGVYQAGERTTIGSEGSLYQRDYRGIGNYSDINAYPFLDYQITSKLRLGISCGGGTRPSNDSASTSNSNTKVTEDNWGARLRFNYRPAEKIAINGIIGWENRSFSSGTSQAFPRVEIGSQYQIFERTLLQVSGYEHVDSSINSNEVAVELVDGLSASVTQQLFNKIQATLAVGGERRKIDANTIGAISHVTNTGNREIGFVQAGVTWNFLTSSSFSIYSKFISQQASSASIAQNYNQTLFGVELMMSY